MTGPEETDDKQPGEQRAGLMKISVIPHGPYSVTGRVPLLVMEIGKDPEGNCRTWRKASDFPEKEEYTLCRCGHSQKKPFCDGTHAKIHFDGTETAGNEPYLRTPEIIEGPELELVDYHGLCVHARFCMRAGGVWNLTQQSDNQEARNMAIEEACNCPAGRLVIRDRKTGDIIEPELEKSIAVIENPARGEEGPLWIRGGIPVFSAEGRPYTVRNRVTLCRCGKSRNKPFCDGRHIIP
ncbi:MAG: CDGSH iron-sulfur domain-containing protein [Methanoregulaceae archaeon]|nr:CDGSH iron-sulfur domain-containing protein [Methanoregulaceae archaeon]